MTPRLLARPLALALACLAVGLTARAGDGTQLDAAVLKKVKAATVHLEVTLPSGSTVEGSGFFTDEPGVVLTNAHVLGMLGADSRPPVKVVVTINSGETDSRALAGKLLGVDRGSDLALLRVEGKNLPEPLKVVPAKDLIETAEVYIFGFPLGKRLGKNITVSKSSVSSLRKENGRLKEIQVNGGMHPGNSGGPVTNAKGEVVGVSVSIITGTALNFAIPGETVHGFLDGKLTEIAVVLGYKDGDKIRMTCRLAAVDPLGRLKNLKVETWYGEPGNRRRPGGNTEPKPLPGDTDRQVTEVKYGRQAVTSFELTVPASPDPKKVYWVQPNFVDGTGKTHWFVAFAPNLGAPVERKEIELTYKPQLGHTQLTELATDGAFRILLEGEEHSVLVGSKSTVSEETAAAKTGDVLPVHLAYRGFNLTVQKDKKPFKVDAETLRDINSMRFVTASLEMGSDGSVNLARADMVKVPLPSRDFARPISDKVMQTVELVAVPLPSGKLKPLQSWKVQRAISLGTGRGVPAQADIKYTYFGTRLLGKREVAVLDVTGRVKGVRGAGLNVGGTVGGLSHVALDTGEVLFAVMNFKADMDLELEDAKDAKAKLMGTLSVRVRRDLPPPKPPEKPAGK